MTDSESDQFRDRLRLMTADIAFLRERVDGILSMLTDRLTDNPASPAPGNAGGGWDSMNREQASGAWQHLTGWVDWFTRSYELHEEIPDCWYCHRAMLEELNALCLAWHGANAMRGTGPADRLYWHEQLDRALPRLRAWNIRGCAGDTHRPATATPARTADHRAREQFIIVDLAARPPAPQSQ